MAKYDAHWWFGSNSIWAQSGAKESFTGVKEKGTESFFGRFKVPMEVDLSPDMKMGLGIVVAIVVLSYIMK